MVLRIASLGPVGTHSETAALIYAGTREEESDLSLYPSIAVTLRSILSGESDLAVVPVENSTEGSVVMTLDALWQLDGLKIQRELVLPISHALLTISDSLGGIQTVYSHPQALAQCQKWIESNLPSVEVIPTNSTTEAVQKVRSDPKAGAIASQRAAKLYNVPILVQPINDYADNCTRFWVMGLNPGEGETRVSLAFNLVDVPGALVKPLQAFANRKINLSRIESRPTKRSLGEYVFFVDVETEPGRRAITAEALEELAHYTDELKVFGFYEVTRLGI